MEIEIKLAVADPDAAVRRLDEMGAVLRGARVFEDNRLFDLPDRALARSGRLLRVREAASRTTVTAKAPADIASPSLYKVRHEAEVVLPDADGFIEVLRVAGFEPTWRYQKYRRTFDVEGAEVTVDETPAGSFLEVEGEPATIERVVELLGDVAGPRFTGTYRDVWAAVCAARGETTGDMLFRPEVLS